MNKTTKITIAFTIIILCIFLLPHNNVYAEEEVVNGKSYTYTTNDDGSSGVSLDSIKFKLTCYGDDAGGSGFFCGLNSSKLTGYDDKYHWGYFEINGVKYVAMAGALHDYIPSSEWGGSSRAGRKYNHIYYFKTGYNTPLDQCEKISFKFEDQSFDSKLYNGIIVDTGPAMMFPQNPNYSFYDDVENCNAIDVYLGAEGETIGSSSPISGKVIIASSDGSFKSESDSEDEELTFPDKILSLVTKLLIWIADNIQKLLDKTGTDLTDKEAGRLLYSPEDLKKTSNKFYKEIQVGDAGANIETKTTKNETVSNTIEDKEGKKQEVFTKDKSNIPVIPIDAYSIVATDIKLFDIDFLNSNTQNDNKLWSLYRGFVSVVSHAILYISVACILGILIWRAILVVVSTYTNNPKVTAQSKKIMNNFIKAVIWIVGIYIFIALMINLYKLAISAVTGENDSKYLIRLDVNDLYSFNTNIIGWARYMTQSTNIAMSFRWSLGYLAMAIVDAICFIAMFIRVFFLGILIIIAPITSIKKINETEVQEKKGLIYMSNWIKVFLITLWIPFLAAALLSLFLHI